MSKTSTTCLQIRNAGLTYRSSRGETPALKEITFDAKHGEFLTVIGPSGCGKSTLLKIIGGLLHPTHGEVLVEGEPAVSARKKAKFGFVFQNPVLLPWRTTLDNACLPLEILQRSDGDDEARKFLKLVGLDGFEDRYPRELSGGMQQRVAIARALVFDPEILLMDEPFGALDEMTRDRMNIDLLRIWSETGKTVIFVTHSIPEAIFLASRVIVLSQRPATVDTIIDVDLPYPRNRLTRENPTFSSLIREGRACLGA